MVVVAFAHLPLVVVRVHRITAWLYGSLTAECKVCNLLERFFSVLSENVVLDFDLGSATVEVLRKDDTVIAVLCLCGGDRGRCSCGGCFAKNYINCVSLRSPGCRREVSLILDILI